MGGLRIGSGSAWWGDRVEPARLNAEQRRSRLSLLRDDGGGDDLGRAGAQAPRPGFPGLRHLPRRPDAGGAARLPQARHARSSRNQGWINPEGAAAADRRTGCASWALKRRQGRRGLRQPDHRPGARADRYDPGERPADLRARAARSSRPRPTSARSRSSRRCAQGAQIVVTGRVADPSHLHGADDARVRLGSARPRTRSAAATASATCSNAAPRSPAAISADPGFKDVPEPWNLGFPDRRGRARRQRRHHQGRGHRRRGQPA